MRSKPVAQAWRTFSARERKQIEKRLCGPNGCRCPRCDEVMEARPTRKAPVLECRTCQRFHPRGHQTPIVMYFMRIQRLATAILSA